MGKAPRQINVIIGLFLQKGVMFCVAMISFEFSTLQLL
jgi:hypothetical protein